MGLPINDTVALCMGNPSRTSHTNNMFSLQLAVCVCVLFSIGIEAAAEPKPWCAYHPCYYTEGGLGSLGIQTYRPAFYNRGYYGRESNRGCPFWCQLKGK